MRVLLIAYEFPPSPSPQSLRWAYLVRELAALGHEVHVLAPDIAGFGRGGLPEIPESVQVHRCYAGPVMGLVASRSHARERRLAAGAPPQQPRPDPPAPTPPEELNWKGRVWHAGLNWKGRIFEVVKRIAAFFTYPDIRGEWEPWARRALLELLEKVQPDVVVSSHEPATTLRLGRLARKMGYPWVADLGDPVLAPYTELRWRLKARRLERAVCREADRVTVTAAPAAELLARRHGVGAERFAVLTQGFDDRLADPGADYATCLFPGDRVELLYTGSFYAFRPASELLAAVLATPGVRLNIASVRVPDEIQAAARQHPDKVRLLGFVAHRDIILLQRRADLLVNLANDDAAQVPGKIYEYLGAGRPVLGIARSRNDGAQALIRELGRGPVCDNQREAIAAELARFASDDPAAAGYRLDRASVERFGWSRIARDLDNLLATEAAAGVRSHPLSSEIQQRAKS